MSKPIITSLLDTDFYKLTMQQAVFHNYPSVVVDARFHCRSEVDLTPLADEVREQINNLALLKLTVDEKEWLGQVGVFKPDYLDWLSHQQLDPDKVDVQISQEALQINVRGSWLEVTLFEIYILAIVSELYGRHIQSGELEVGRRNLHNKIHHLKQHLQETGSAFHFVDFGTRRRFSSTWHRELVTTLQKELPENFQGTSNIMLARELGLAPVGTMGHEWLQAHQALVPDLVLSQREALEVWHHEYQGELGIALTDTITMSAFLNDFDRDLALRYSGLRHDSGDPVEWGERAVSHFEKVDIDPCTRTLVFSDGLDFDKSLAISEHFSGRIHTSFGIGTWLTNDVGGKPLNIVLKLVSCNGQPVAKISDAPGKTMCLDTEYVDRLKRVYSVI